MTADIHKVAFGGDHTVRPRTISADRDVKLSVMAMEFVAQLPQDSAEAFRILTKCAELVAWAHKMAPDPCGMCGRRLGLVEQG